MCPTPFTGTVPAQVQPPQAHFNLADMPDVTTFSLQNRDHDPRYFIVVDGGDMDIIDAMDYLVRMETFDGGIL